MWFVGLRVGFGVRSRCFVLYDCLLVGVIFVFGVVL